MTPPANSRPHRHCWDYPHRIIQGRYDEEVAVVRICRCGRREVAFASNWKRATGDYARPEHYEEAVL